MRFAFAIWLVMAAGLTMASDNQLNGDSPIVVSQSLGPWTRHWFMHKKQKTNEVINYTFSKL